MAEIFSIPSLLQRLANKLRGYLTQEANNRKEWVAIQEGICLTLVEARDQFPADVAFGEWCDANGFSKDVINHQTRAAAIVMGREPEALRKCLEATGRRSLEKIYRHDFARFTHVRKPTEQPKSRRKTKATEKTDAAREALRPIVEAGGIVSREKLATQTGVSTGTIQRAELQERARLEAIAEAQRDASLLDPATMKLTMQQRYEATVRAAKKQIREELIIEVKTEIHKAFEEGYLKHWRERVAESDRIYASHKDIMFRKDFRMILAGLHPDHNTFEHAREAFELFKKLESVLVKPDPPIFSGPPLPTTVAEMMARRRGKRA